jgi:hypothetical protein
MERKLAIILIGLAVTTGALAQVTRYIDPMLGVDGGGNTFPGPSLPFGMIKPGPEMGDNKGNAGWTEVSIHLANGKTFVIRSQECNGRKQIHRPRRMERAALHKGMVPHPGHHARRQVSPDDVSTASAWSTGDLPPSSSTKLNP